MLQDNFSQSLSGLGSKPYLNFKIDKLEMESQQKGLTPNYKTECMVDSKSTVSYILAMFESNRNLTLDNMQHKNSKVYRNNEIEQILVNYFVEQPVRIKFSTES